jgi:selenide,water dikinase
MTAPPHPRLTSLAHGGGCACKIPASDLDAIVASLPDSTGDGALLVGLESGDDAAVVEVADGFAVVATTDFFTPVVDDPYDWGRIAAANALSDVYAMGGEPVVAVNLLGWPVGRIALEIAHEVLRGGAAVCAEAPCHLAGGHSIDSPEPIYGLSVTGRVQPDELIRNDSGRAGLPLTLTKPLGVGVLNNRLKMTGETFPDAVASMVRLNRDASRAARRAGIICGTDVTGFGLLGHLLKLVRASGVGAVIDHAAVPYLDGTRDSIRSGYLPGGSQRNLDWVRPHLDTVLDEDELLLLSDAQTSGGLLVAGELPGYPVIGELVASEHPSIAVR